MSPGIVRRTAFRRKPRRGRSLGRAQWGELYDRVIARHREIVRKVLRFRLGEKKAAEILRDHLPCPAVVMDPSQLGTCSGPWQLDHVKKDPRIGVKAEDEERRLVPLCATHDERGARAGYIWNSANRDKEREYLASIFGPDTD